MILKGISLAGSKPKSTRVKDIADRKKKVSEYNKKYYKNVTKKKRKKENPKLDGHSKKAAPRKTYIDVYLEHNEQYKNMNVLERQQFKKDIQKRLYSRRKVAGLTLATPINDPWRNLQINYNALLYACEIMTDNSLRCILLLSAFIDKEDGILRTSRNGYITLREISEITGRSIDGTRYMLRELNKQGVIHIDGISRDEFKDIYEWEAAKLEYSNDLLATLANKEYRIYVNPFFIFTRQYIDKDVAVKYFYGSEWVLHNNHSKNIMSWIEKNCE